MVKNIQYNKVIVSYYERLLQKHDELLKGRTKKETFERKTESIRECNNFWFMDVYRLQKVKDFKKTNLCKDKFCANCKKVKQASRMARYIPELEQHKDNLYHMTLTLPNCAGQELGKIIGHMAKCFQKLISYLNGHHKNVGLNLNQWGYRGAVRSLEITFNGETYHPHYHVGLVLDKPPGRKVNQNTYSFDFRNGLPDLKRLFSDEEILIQKIWYLLISGARVTKKAIEELELGYSCTLDRFQPGDYAELFKYMTKEVDERGKVLAYNTFETLYFALYRLKQIQGYGCLYRITDTEDTEAFDAAYDAYIDGLREKENPELSREAPRDLLRDSHYALISRKAYYKYLRQLYHEQRMLNNE